MPYLFCYTRKGEDRYRDLNDAMHLALSYDGRDFIPLLNNTGVLFPEADPSEGTMAGTTKTLRWPWLFRFPDGSGGVLAVQHNNLGSPDLKVSGSAMVYRTKDFVFYTLQGFLKLDDWEIKNPRCCLDKATGKYRIEWTSVSGHFSALTEDFKTISGKAPAPPSLNDSCSFGITDAQPGNVIEISEAEADCINKMLGKVYNVAALVPELKLKIGTSLTKSMLPKAECFYSDGSTHKMDVNWNPTAIRNLNTSKAGEYKVSGRIKQKIYPAPFIPFASDPCVFKYNGKYFFTSSGAQVVLRGSDTLEGLQETDPVVIYKEEDASFWAQELHYIKGVPYVFTSHCKGNNWTTVQSVILRCKGDPMDPLAWEAPRFVLKPDGSLLNKDKGICLDMTYFCIDEVHYVSWSGRDINRGGDGANEYGSNGPADVLIATIDPDAPWQLKTDPVRLCTPTYGWERAETEVVEGSYLLRHGDDLFLTYSGASVGVVYAVGVLRAKYGSDLLNPASWERIPYPLLTRESVPDQYGPGHNNFFKDPVNEEDDMIALLYRPHPEWIIRKPGQNDTNPRHSAIRRVHWNASGLPNLEMTPDQELDPALADVVLKIKVEN